MNSNQVRLFLAIVKTGSFSLAADDMFISQSSISKQIKALETELGVALFRREHAKVFLTEAGTVFLAYARTALHEYEKLQLRLEQYQADKANTIRMGSIPIVSSYGIAKRIASFVKLNRNGKVSFNMHESDQRAVKKELDEGVIDLALLRVDKLNDTALYDMIPFMVDEFVLVCHEDHFLASAQSVGLEEIACWPFLVLDEHSQQYNIVTEAFAKANLPLRIHCSTTRHKILLEMVSVGMGIALLPRNLADTSLFHQVRVVDLKEPVTSCIALVKRRDREFNRISQEFWRYWQTNYALTAPPEADAGNSK